MNKDNIFCSSEFYMAENDRLHMIIKDESGNPVTWVLSGDYSGEVPGKVIIDDATNILSTSFSANWFFLENSEGYYLDVSTDAEFDFFLAGFENKDVGNVNTYSVTGLAHNTVYYYRVRAYNATGTGVDSDTESLTTADVVALVDLDGNEYTTVKIGNQEWIVENFRCTKYADSTAITNVTDNYEWVNGVSVTKRSYGALYNWYAATYADPSAPLVSIAPSGWHVPTQAEFTTLITYLGGNSVAGGKMKSTGTSLWTTPNTGADNSSGFSGVPSGVRSYSDGSFGSQGTDVFYASTTLADATHFYATTLVYNSAQSWESLFSPDVKVGVSIRLVKDSTTLSDGETGTMTDYDGNTYGTICIGTQEWMSENLKVEHYNDGTAITKVTDASAWAALSTEAMCYYNNDDPVIDGAYCWYDNDITNKADYGALYNWYAVDVDPSDSKDLAYLERGGVQEGGWRSPTTSDWEELKAYLGGYTGGGKLKATGTDYWTTPNTGATDEYGFDGRGAGVRDSVGVFANIQARSVFATETSILSNYVLSAIDSYLGMNASSTTGFSVRLVRDYPQSPVTCDSTLITCDSLTVTSDMT